MHLLLFAPLELNAYRKWQKKFEREVISESIRSGETISVVKNMMKNVVEKKHGTAHNIYSEDISLAGKTGTCQTDYWKESGLYISSFVGYFPADKPKYSCAVVIHKPNKNKGYYGNIVAAPVFKEIAQKIESLINTLNPKVRYKVGAPLQKISGILKSLLPSRIFEKLLMNHYCQLLLNQYLIL